MSGDGASEIPARLVRFRALEAKDRAAQRTHAPAPDQNAPLPGGSATEPNAPIGRERPLSWERVARILGERLRCQGDYAVCEEGHTETEAVRDCPFCEDRHAFRIYQRKIGEKVDRGMTH